MVVSLCLPRYLSVAGRWALLSRRQPNWVFSDFGGEVEADADFGDDHLTFLVGDEYLNSVCCVFFGDVLGSGGLFAELDGGLFGGVGCAPDSDLVDAWFCVADVRADEADVVWVAGASR